MHLSEKYMCDGYYVYFTAKCLIEVFHVHASKDKKPRGAAKFWVYEDGSTLIADKGRVPTNKLNNIQGYIKRNYMKLYKDWVDSGGPEGFYEK